MKENDQEPMKENAESVKSIIVEHILIKDETSGKQLVNKRA